MPPRFLMCLPEHFGVNYTINPWMDPQSWARQETALIALSQHEWAHLYRTLAAHGAAIELIPPVPGLPDLVFTANAAVVLDGKAVLSRFRHPERQREETHVAQAFRVLQGRGAVDAVRELPAGLVLEGAGDCVWDRDRNLFWMGYGLRSDAASRDVVRETWAVEVVALELADPRFYHIDTALSPLPGGEVIYFPSAFTRVGRATIRERVAPDQRIEINIEDAGQLSANAVCLGNTVVLSGCSKPLRAQLEGRGYRVVVTPLRAFARSGGAAFCLTLRLDVRSAARDDPLSHAAVA
jgi:N-dimethylarginine dimethylaminohydrolase